jgi:hypothetical protein
LEYLILVLHAQAAQWHLSPIEGTYLAANTSGMAKKPEPPQPTSWNVYRVAAKATWLGTVEAPDATTAIEKAAGISTLIRGAC